MKIVQLVPWRDLLLALGDDGSLWGCELQGSVVVAKLDWGPLRIPPESDKSSREARWWGWQEEMSALVAAVAAWDEARESLQFAGPGTRSGVEHTDAHMALQNAERDLLRAFRPFRR